MHSSKLYLFKRGPRFYIQFHDQDGKQRQVSTGCTVKADALRYLRDHETSYTSNCLSKNLPDFIEEFSSYGRNVYSHATFRSYHAALRNLLSLTGNIRMVNITPRIADKFKSFRHQTVSPTSTNIDLRSLKATFKIAVRWGFISDNPFKGTELLTTPQIEPKFLSSETYTTLIASIRENWLRSIVQFAVFTGMRVSEITNLRWEQVHFDRKIIAIVNTSHFQTKNRRNRIVPISTPVLSVLNEMNSTRVSEYVFHNMGKKLCPTYASKRFKMYIRMLHLDESLHFHNLRSTFASWMIMSGVDIYVVSKLLGHSDVSVTSKHYANVHNEFLFGQLSSIKQFNSNYLKR